jgi:hypothetical protein
MTRYVVPEVEDKAIRYRNLHVDMIARLNPHDPEDDDVQELRCRSGRAQMRPLAD